MNIAKYGAKIRRNMRDNKKKTGHFLLTDTFTVQQIQPCLTCAVSYQLNYSGEKKWANVLKIMHNFLCTFQNLSFKICVTNSLKQHFLQPP